MKILFSSSEVHPLVKTGGLADVSSSLPKALKNLRHDVRVILPAYREVLQKTTKTKKVASLAIKGTTQTVNILETRLPDSTVKLYLVDAPEFFDREGGPYGDTKGIDWPDNPQRFTAFARAAVEVALDNCGLKWRPDLVHCNDWQTGLIPPLLSEYEPRPATLFTVHNLAYHGLSDWNTFQQLELPARWWSYDALEFHSGMSMIKGGLVFADWITTVSPTYAKEICTEEFGCGLEGLLQHRKEKLTGILNGVDYNTWNPAKDSQISYQYNSRSIDGKAKNKRALQQHFGLPEKTDIPLFAHVGRLVEQKGIDLLLNILPQLIARDIQIVIVGSGQIELEKALTKAHKQHPKNIGVFIGYDEKLAHLLEAGADAFLMPSRFEPCGLNQMYSLKYGTLPIVRNTGGLSNTVVDTTEATLDDGSATGFVFQHSKSTELLEVIERAASLYRQPIKWRRVMRNAMRQDHSWRGSAKEYVQLYEKILNSKQ